MTIQKFVRQFHKIGKLIEEKNLESADELFRETYNTFDLSLYEFGKLRAQRARIDAMQGDLYKLDMALERATDEVASLRPAIDQLISIIDSDEILKIPAEVRSRGDCTYCNSSWNFAPVRNDFTFTNINGTLTSVDMSCDHKRLESNVADRVEWHIPAKWGKCHIQVYGEPGTTFDVMMLPKDKTWLAQAFLFNA